jgi:probable F420-dependent oxidoreductase
VSADRPFRFGLQDTAWAGDASRARAAIEATARRAEAAGFDVYTTADHPMAAMRPPLSTLLVAADATSRLRIGTAVLNSDLWNPVLLARDVAALHLLSGGRFELGLGAGHAQLDYAAVGVAFEAARVRVSRLAVAVPLIRRLLAGEVVTTEGGHYPLSGAEVGVPSAGPPPPILVGGNGNAVLSIAGEHADIVGLTALVRNLDQGHVHQPDWSSAYLDDRIATVLAASRARTMAPELNALVQRVQVTEDREATAAAICRHAAASGIDLRAGDALTTPFLLFGTIEEMAAQLLATRRRYGISYVTTRTDSLETMAQVIGAVRRAEGTG